MKTLKSFAELQVTGEEKIRTAIKQVEDDVIIGRVVGCSRTPQGYRVLRRYENHPQFALVQRLGPDLGAKAITALDRAVLSLAHCN